MRCDKFDFKFYEYNGDTVTGKMLVTGSRGIAEPWAIYKAIDHWGLDPNGIIHGGAAGVDTMAHGFAMARKLPEEIYIPKWDLYGKRAALVRNDEMVAACDFVLGIWDGKSTGTAYTLKKARHAGKPVYLVIIKEKADGSTEEDQ